MKIKNQVLEFMKNTDTSDMNSNQFIYEFLDMWSIWKSSQEIQKEFLNAPSVEWLTRARRYIIKAYWIWIRTKAESENKYIKEFCLNNIY